MSHILPSSKGSVHIVINTHIVLLIPRFTIKIQYWQHRFEPRHCLAFGIWFLGFIYVPKDWLAYILFIFFQSLAFPFCVNLPVICQFLLRCLPRCWLVLWGSPRCGRSSPKQNVCVNGMTNWHRTNTTNDSGIKKNIP